MLEWAEGVRNRPKQKATDKSYLNPRYFEEVITLDEAKNKIYSSDIVFSSKFNPFRPY